MSCLALKAPCGLNSSTEHCTCVFIVCHKLGFFVLGSTPGLHIDSRFRMGFHLQLTFHQLLWGSLKTENLSRFCCGYEHCGLFSCCSLLLTEVRSLPGHQPQWPGTQLGCIFAICWHDKKRLTTSNQYEAIESRQNGFRRRNLFLVPLTKQCTLMLWLYTG